jgi:DNA end-binding protein Ku
MAARPTWQGHLKLSLVSCPVALYSAVERSGDVHFNMLHKTTHNRIRMIPTDPETGPVERGDIVKGYEIEKDRYVVVTPEEIDAVRLESARTLDIDRFVDEADIDRLYWNDPYFLVPDGKGAAEAYAVIREAMAEAGKVALGRLVLHQRERLFALEPRGEGLIAWSLRTHDEVRDAADFFGDIPNAKVDPSMIDIAGKIIAQKEGPFDPSTFTDRYEDALRALIREKEKGAKTVVRAEEPDDGKVVDLMEALRKSLGRPGATRSKPPARAPTKKTATRAGKGKKRA